MDEMFSRVTARYGTYRMVELQDRHRTCSSSQEEIIDMQCDLLISRFKNSKTIALVKENIGYASNGASPHGAIAVNLAFKKVFEVKKRQRGVLLRCSDATCAWSMKSVPYSSVKSSAYCPSLYHKDSEHRLSLLHCVGCGYDRIDIYDSCQGCGMKFL